MIQSNSEIDIKENISNKKLNINIQLLFMTLIFKMKKK